MPSIYDDLMVYDIGFTTLMMNNSMNMSDDSYSDTISIYIYIYIYVYLYLSISVISIYIFIYNI
jgi:hypothetical protein